MGNGASQQGGAEGDPTDGSEQQQQQRGQQQDDQKVSAVDAFKDQRGDATRGKTEEEEEEEAYQREKERLAALKEKRDKERAAASAAATANSPPSAGRNAAAADRAPPPAADAKGGSNAASAPPAPPDNSGKKKKRLLNGANIEYRYPSGSHYVGGFKDGKLHGFGKYHYHPSGDVYEGEWLADMKHGQGTYSYDGGDKYVGEWRAGKKHGKGTYSFTTGDEYVGSWKEDKIHGYGVFTIARNGNRYEGNWEESYRHGHGVLRSGNGDVYEGGWVRGKEEGLGVLTFANSNIYAGDWRSGQMDGKGIMLEKGQKFTVEHIAGYLISKIAVEMDAQIDPDWNKANKLFVSHLNRKSGGGDGGGGGGDNAAGGGAGGAGGVDAEQLTKIRLERDMFKKKYEDLLNKKGGSVDDDEDCDTDDVDALRRKIVELKEQRDIERQRADDLSTREKVLMTENQELLFKMKDFDVLKQELDELKKSGGGAGGAGGTGGSVSEAQVVSLQRRCAELEREVAARKAGAASKSPDDPLELKVKLELAEGEIRVLRNAASDLQRAREQNRELQSTIQQLEQRNEELLKEMSVHRQRATHLQDQIQDASSKAAEDLQSEIRDLRSENRELQGAKSTLEDQLKKSKKKAQEYAERARQADELEVQVTQLRKATGSDSAALNKNLDKKNEQVDALRKQNAELQRQLEEMQHDMEMNRGGAAATNGTVSPAGGKKEKKGKKDKKHKKGALDDDDGGGGGDAAGVHGDAAAALAELQADLKKEKKKHKKAAQERDALAMQLWTEQMRVVALQQLVEASQQGRVLVSACVNPKQTANGAVGINAEDPSQLDVDTGGGHVESFHFDDCFVADRDAEWLREPGKGAIAAAIATGVTASFVTVGPMGSGKSHDVQQLAPLVFAETFSAAAAAASADEEVLVDATAVEIANDGLVDLVAGPSAAAPSTVSPMKSALGRVVLVGAVQKSVAGPAEAAATFTKAAAARTKPRSHLIFTLDVTIKNKIDGSFRVARVNVVDVAGQGPLGEQPDIASAKFVNQSNVALSRVIDALASNSPAVPYRDDLLTQVLADALGGNSITCVTLAVAHTGDNVHELINAINMAQKAAKIKNGPLLPHVESRETIRLRQMVASYAGEEAAAPVHQEITSLRH